MTTPWVPGEVVTRREVLHGRLWLEHPVTVVEDDGTTFAVLLEPGSPFTFHGHPIGPHPWGAHLAWGGTTVLQVHRTGERYSVWKFFVGDVFQHWYVNFESPVVRDDDGFDTDDHGLDLLVHPDGRREWKDVEHLHEQRAQGRIDLATVGAVLEAADEVVRLLDADDRWWAEYDDWVPEPAPR
ncbi:DUF402 domain-containing protein [Nocardioides sp. Soil805]|uniref:DUF402 domain-containing protein n=1 Tax=Nocardioides sp. Soil805 TaxID=1736416 RepID=UPI000703280D|nr:DUF402 domain-containing protein [Nocardioides sp. Soil805]KRF29396.1 hypothetical protein ASG94_20650 [Nocardioides sp. Soil805]